MLVTIERLRERLKRHAPRRVREPGAREAAVAVVLASETARLDLLLIKRAEHPGDPWSGQMALPGGRRDPEDPDLLATAIRETWEELGIQLDSTDMLGELDDLHPRVRTLPEIVVRPFVFVLPRKPSIAQSAEVALHLWVPLDDFMAGPRDEVEIATAGLRLPAYRLGEHVVWGMTERILTPFFDLAR